jgi:glycosyltransferase involved in cell wall biosynthesis
MHVLFVHRAFPAQFGRLALELARRHGWKCSAVVEHLSACPSPSPEMLRAVAVQQLPRRPGAAAEPPWPQVYGDTLERAAALAALVLSQPGLRPDLVVGHGGLLPTLLLRDVLDCPFVDYCEYYFANAHRDLTYRADLPAVDHAPFYPRCINAATLVSLVAADAAYTPTRWQRDCFPQRFADKIEVHFDGIDTDLYCPGPASDVPLPGVALPLGGRIVTYVARGLESMRGFDLFLELARRIERARPDVCFVIAGDEQAYYGWDRQHTGGVSFKDWVLARGGFDLSRCVFLGHVEPQVLAAVLWRSDLHVYLSVPFVLSWSLLNALACGCIVLAGDVPPVREVIEPGRSGLVEPLFDLERLTQTALAVLDRPAEFRPLGEAGRRLMEERYSLEVAVPALKDFFERAAAAGRKRP